MSRTIRIVSRQVLSDMVPTLPWPPHVTRPMGLRMAADAVMVNVSLFIAVALRSAWWAAVEGPVGAGRAIPLAYVRDAYLGAAWVLTPICILVFWGSGFYTHGRAYRGHFKALVVARAVTLSYLIFAFVILALRDVLGFPRSAIILSWVITLVLLMGARLWIALWRIFDQAERHFLPSGTDAGRAQSVLVIGGAGYIGSALTERLLEEGYRVRVLDLLLYGDEAIAEFRGHPRFELIRGDLRHVNTVVRATKGVDAVVHLGAIVGDSACGVCEDLTIKINLEATRTIAEVAKGFGVRRFVFASTCSVYGASDELLDERSHLSPLSLYARTKVQSEEILLNMTDAEFAPVILRFGTIYGLSGRPRFDLVVNLLAAKAVQEGEVGIFGGKQWRPLVHVRDVAEAILLTLRASHDTVCGQIFNVGSNEQNYQIADLGPIIHEMVPTARIITQPQEDNRNYRVRFDKILNALSFRPRYTVRDGVAEIIEAMESGRITDYRDPRYTNLAYLRQHSELQHTLLDDHSAPSWNDLSGAGVGAVPERAESGAQLQAGG